MAGKDGEGKSREERTFSDEEVDRSFREVFLSRDCMNCSNNSSGPLGEKGRMGNIEYFCSARKIRVSIYSGESTAKECPQYENIFLKHKQEGEQR